MNQTKQSKTTLKFPKNFLWGASISSHQVEGGNHNQWSVWELETARTRASQAEENYGSLPVWGDIKKQAMQPSNYVSGAASDHYARYEEDFALAKKLNLTTLRSGIEWSRIEPNEGEFDPQALEHYRQYFDAMEAQGITPVLTLWHWTFPEWFADKGGFTKRRNVKYFTRYVDYVSKNIGRNFAYVITINEPTIYSVFSYQQKRWPPEEKSLYLALRVLSRLKIAHKKSYKILKKRWPRVQIGLAHNCSYFYQGDDSIITRLTAWVLDLVGNRYAIHGVSKYQDFLGLNYYFANKVIGTRVHNPESPQNDLGWTMEPDKLRPMINHLYNQYKIPILVTESGVADMHDQYRQWWISESIKAMSGAMADGSKMIGYIHWSLLDNFEWSEGFWPRFGLIEVDYTTQRRTIRDSAKWYGRFVAKMRNI